MPYETRPKLLVVDDVEANIDILLEVLSEDYAVRVAIDGPTALSSVRKALPDLILLDVMMPGMDGFEVCRRLKADPTTAEIPIVFLTAMHEDEDVTYGLDLGAIDYITKPFNPAMVKARVRNHLELKRHRDHLSALVVERTGELAIANDRLKELSRLKDDFLQMIAHEIRTPANGVLGIGELIIDMCPPSEECTLFSRHFRLSKKRLLNLIEDSTLITSLDNLTPGRGAATPISVILAGVRGNLPDKQISLDLKADQDSVSLLDDQGLLQRALETMILLASHFSRNEHAVHLIGTVDGGLLRVCVELDNLSLSGMDASGFFEIESLARAASPAEQLGLAPVVAHKIITAFRGEMRLVKGEGKAGYLEAILRYGT